MHGIARRIVGILILWLAAGAAQSAERLYLWEVKDSAASVYLFGSVHLCRADCFPLPGGVLAAFNRAEYLAVELDPTRPGVQEALLRQSLYAAGDSLERHISPELARNLRQATARLGIPSEALLRMKPWMAGTTLTVVGALRAGYKADDGIDLWFLQRARNAPKTVVELESAQQQASALEGLAADVQASILVQAVALVLDDSLGSYLDGLLAAWRGGDSDGLYRLSQVGMEDGAAAQAMLDAMLVERNRAMTQRIVRLMATGRPGFVVVGALHLAGEQSIVEMLRSRGYEVRQVESP
jgi:uncharacterized protein YbaP (TraB family)